jgi:hypothetical protein
MSIGYIAEMTPEELLHLAQGVRLTIPAEDLASVAAALEAHGELVEPLLTRDMRNEQSALSFDPRWHGED